MFSFIQKCCEYIFPTRTDYQLVMAATDVDLKHLLTVKRTDAFVSLMDFKEPLVRALIHEAKFHSNEKAWRMLGSVAGEYLKQLPPGTLIVPIPLSSKRQRQRGYNQVTEVIKRALPLAPEIKLVTNHLHRRRDTTPQTSLKKKDRLKNMEGAFIATWPETWSNYPVVIVDDVATTGATLKAASAAFSLVHHGPVTLLSWTH